MGDAVGRSDVGDNVDGADVFVGRKVGLKEGRMVGAVEGTANLKEIITYPSPIFDSELKMAVPVML